MQITKPSLLTFLLLPHIQMIWTSQCRFELFHKICAGNIPSIWLCRGRTQWRIRLCFCLLRKWRPVLTKSPFISGNVTSFRVRNLCAGGRDHDMSIIIALSVYLMLSTGRNHMFPYFWNVAETWNSMVPLCLRLAETWKFYLIVCHVTRTEMPSHVSVIFKLTYFRCCSVGFRRVSANGFAVVCYIYQNTNARWLFEQQWILTF